MCGLERNHVEKNPRPWPRLSSLIWCRESNVDSRDKYLLGSSSHSKKITYKPCCMACTPLEYRALIHSLGLGVGVGLYSGAGVDILEIFQPWSNSNPHDVSSTAILVAYHRRFLPLTYCNGVTHDLILLSLKITHTTGTLHRGKIRAFYALISNSMLGVYFTSRTSLGRSVIPRMSWQCNRVIGHATCVIGKSAITYIEYKVRTHSSRTAQECSLPWIRHTCILRDIIDTPINKKGLMIKGQPCR